MSTAASISVAGIVIQLLGAAYLVLQAFRTRRRLIQYTNVTYDNFALMIGDLASELRGQFLQQLIGFAIVVLGSALQLYGAIAA